MTRRGRARGGGARPHDTGRMVRSSAVVGVGMRHRWGAPRAALAAMVVVWPPVALVTVGLLVYLTYALLWPEKF